MKKILSLVVAMVMVMSMVGCGKATDEVVTSTSTETVVNASVEETTSTEPVHYESDQTKTEDEIVADSGIDKENACATETIYITIEKVGSHTYTMTLPDGITTYGGYLNFDENLIGKTLQINAYYFAETKEEYGADNQSYEVTIYEHEEEYIILD